MRKIIRFILEELRAFGRATMISEFPPELRKKWEELDRKK